MADGEGGTGSVADAFAPEEGSDESLILSRVQSDLAARAIRRYEKERVVQMRLKKKIMKSMLSTMQDDTTQFILDSAQAALLSTRRYIEKFLGYDDSDKGLKELWAKAQMLLDMLDPFQQLPGVSIPVVGDITDRVEDFAVMRKVIWETIPPEEREKIKEEIAREKESGKKPTTWEKAGAEVSDQAKQTWNAVKIFVQELPRINENLIVLCLLKVWGLIVKICKILGIPIDVFPLDLLQDVPEIIKLAKQLERNGGDVLDSAFTEMMAPVYISRAMMDSTPTTADKKLSVVCISLVDNKYQIEFQKSAKKIADLKLRRARCQRQRNKLEDKIEDMNAEINSYGGSQFYTMKEAYSEIKKEAEERLNVVNSSIDRINEKLPLEEEAQTAISSILKDTTKIAEEGTRDFEKAMKMVADKNEKIMEAMRAREQEMMARKLSCMNADIYNATDAVGSPTTGGMV